MNIFSEAYSLISKSFKYDAVKDFKERLRPIKHSLFGKEGLYYAIDVAKNLKKGQEVYTVFDVGAAVGDTTRTLLRSFPKAKVYCFEPLPESFKRLEKRTTEWKDRVLSLNYGLYNQNGEVQFRVSQYNDSS